jgi:hypothetical protein
VNDKIDRGQVGSSTIAAVVDTYRDRLAEDSIDFTLALQELAKTDANGATPFNSPSPQDAVALHALARWRRDAQHALKEVRTAPPGPLTGLAEKWLKTLIAALDLQRQGLSIVSPTKAAHATSAARKKIAAYRRLEERLEGQLE